MRATRYIPAAAGRHLLLGITSSLFITADTQAQTVRGRVIGEADGAAVSQASIVVVPAVRDTILMAVLSYDGSFLFDLPEPGSYRVRVEALGYATLTSTPVHVAHSTVITLELRLRADAIALEPLHVVSERIEPEFMRDVRRRTRIGFGRLLTREVLDGRFGSRLEDVLRDAGLRVQDVPVRGGSQRTAPLVTARQAGLRQCYASLYLNGVIQYSQERSDPDALHRVWELFQYRPQDIEAVEIYRGAAEVPAEYAGSNAACGVVALWLRNGAEPWRGEDAEPLAVPLRAAINLTGSRYGYEGKQTPQPALQLEVGALWSVYRGLWLGLRFGGGQHVVASDTVAEIMRAYPRDPGQQDFNALLLVGSLESRYDLPAVARLTPFVTARATLARRSLGVDSRYIDRRQDFYSHGVGYGIGGGVDIRITDRVEVEAASVHDRLSFGGYRLLDIYNPSSDGVWTATSLRVGLVRRF